jgi:hypothetical protein
LLLESPCKAGRFAYMPPVERCTILLIPTPA